MSQENVEMARAALNAFAELDEGLIDAKRMEEFIVAGFDHDLLGLRGLLGEANHASRRR